MHRHQRTASHGNSSLPRENQRLKRLKPFEKAWIEEKVNPLIPESAPHLSGAEYTLKIMEQAPVIIFIANTLGSDVRNSQTPDMRIGEICNAQSIGASIENMILTATELGLGSLWICDTYFAHEEITDWMDTGYPHFATLAIGYADENPAPRPRNSMSDVVEWRE